MSAQPAAVEMPATFRLRVALSELEANDAELFRASLQRLEEKLPHYWEWADLAHADVAIVDMDSLFGHMAWLKAQGAGKQVITFARNRTHGSELVLGKPLDDVAFATVLEQAAGHIDASEGARRPHEPVRKGELTVTARPDSAPAEFDALPSHVPVSVIDLAAAGDIPSPAEPAANGDMGEAAEPEPEPRNVAEMLARRLIVEPARVGDGDLVIDPEHDAYYSAETALKPLKSLLESACDALQPLDADALAGARKGKPQPLARLRWFAGLVAMPGELMHGLKADDKYKLARWPQTEREFPRHFRIATAMMKQAAVPGEIAQASGTPVADVIDYINASRAAGWLAVERDEAVPVEAEAGSRGNVLSRFRKPRAR